MNLICSAYMQPLMLIVPDVQDVYTPLETDDIVQLSEVSSCHCSGCALLIFLTVSIPNLFLILCYSTGFQCRQHLEILLESIPTMFQESKSPESAFGAAVKVCDCLM